jgi:hypothetical protein
MTHMNALPHPDPLEAEISALCAELGRQARQIERLTAVTMMQGGQLSVLLAAAGHESDPDKHWLTPKMVEIDFGYSRSTIARWIKTDVVIVRRVGGRILIDARTIPK